MFKDKYGNQLTVSQALPKISNRLGNYWLDTKLLLLRITGLIPFHTIRIFIYKISGIKIGRGSRIHIGANFYDPTKIKIGQDTMVGDHVFLDGRDSITIGNHVDIASDVMIYNSEHNLNSEEFEATYGAVNISDYVFIGPRVIILPNVNLGKGSVVAAGAVVTKDVGDFVVVGGVPAKPIGERKNKNPKYVLGRARLFQ